jgi:hypothetical protein
MDYNNVTLGTHNDGRSDRNVTVLYYENILNNNILTEWNATSVLFGME